MPLLPTKFTFNDFVTLGPAKSKQASQQKEDLIQKFNKGEHAPTAKHLVEECPFKVGDFVRSRHSNSQGIVLACNLSPIGRWSVTYTTPDDGRPTVRKVICASAEDVEIDIRRQPALPVGVIELNFEAPFKAGDHIKHRHPKLVPGRTLTRRVVSHCQLYNNEWLVYYTTSHFENDKWETRPFAGLDMQHCAVFVLDTTVTDEKSSIMRGVAPFKIGEYVRFADAADHITNMRRIVKACQAVDPYWYVHYQKERRIDDKWLTDGDGISLSIDLEIDPEAINLNTDWPFKASDNIQLNSPDCIRRTVTHCEFFNEEWRVHYDYSDNDGRTGPAWMSYLQPLLNTDKETK